MHCKPYPTQLIPNGWMTLMRCWFLWWSIGDSKLLDAKQMLAIHIVKSHPDESDMYYISARKKKGSRSKSGRKMVLCFRRMACPSMMMEASKLVLFLCMCVSVVSRPSQVRVYVYVCLLHLYFLT